jgi:hypothetical protein
MKKLRKIVNLIFRLIVLPFISVIVVIASTRNALYTIVSFILFGGEWNSYRKLNESKSINDCYQLLRSLQSGNVAVFKFEDLPELAKKIKNQLNSKNKML